MREHHDAHIAAPGATEFKVAYTTSQGGGNGIRLLDWSPSGDRLLAEITFWTYESDAGFGYLPVIYDAPTNSAREVQAMDKALVGFLGSDCVFEDHVRGWRSEERLLVRVSPSVGVEEDEESSCVKQQLLFLYDLRKDLLQPFQAKSKRD